METIHFPVALSLYFMHSMRGKTRRLSARSLHSFRVERYDGNCCNLIAADGAIAYGVGNNTFERLPAGYSWVKFKTQRTLAVAKRVRDYWEWQPETVEFEPDRFYAIKILPSDSGQTGSCNFQTKDRKIFPYVDRGYFSVVSEMRNSTLPRVLEAYPLPVPGVRDSPHSHWWEAPIEYESIPVIVDNKIASRLRSPTMQVAALRLEFDDDKNPVYRCSYFGPALK